MPSSDRTTWSVQDYEDRLHDAEQLLALHQAGLVSNWQWELELLDRQRGGHEVLNHDPIEELDPYLDWEGLLFNRPKSLTAELVFYAYLREWYGSWTEAAQHLGIPRSTFMRRVAELRRGARVSTLQPDV